MEANTISTEQILSNLQLTALNDMQMAATAACSQHNDVAILSPTGSGKTIAFLLSIISKLDAANKNVQALIIVPSRELALQIEEVFKKMSTGFKITCCYGGHKREIEENNLIQPPALIVGTAGRLADHIRRNNFSLTHITTLVLDEFDKSLELGFQEEMAAIIKSLPALTHRILTSATRAEYLPDFLGIKEVEYVDFLGNHIEKKHIADEVIIQTLLSEDKDKSAILTSFLSFIDNKSAIVFCNHRDAVERTNTILRKMD
jgi:superfamily II DNA/RNA helicase